MNTVVRTIRLGCIALAFVLAACDPSSGRESVQVTPAPELSSPTPPSPEPSPSEQQVETPPRVEERPTPADEEQGITEGPDEGAVPSAAPDHELRGQRDGRDMTFNVPAPCHLDRLEAEVHVIGDATGRLNLVAPDGASAGESLNVTTTSNFKRLMSWDRLGKLHALRGVNVAGQFRLQERFGLATRYGGQRPVGARVVRQRGSRAELRAATLRVWCKREVPLTAHSTTITSDLEMERTARRTVSRSLFRVSHRCVMTKLRVTLHVPGVWSAHTRLHLITPWGDKLRFPGSRRVGGNKYATHYEAAVATHESDGVWEIVERDMGAGFSGLGDVALGVECAPDSGTSSPSE